MKKKISILLIAVLTFAIVGCGASDKQNDSDNTEKDANLTGTCAEILEQVYANADLEQDLRDAMEYYENSEISADSVEYVIGTSDINYTDSVYSAPMMSSVAYQCVLLRLSEDQDIEEAKTLLKENADPIKWVCVEAESVVVENVGDVVLCIMADEATTTAVKDAFLALE